MTEETEVAGVAGSGTAGVAGGAAAPRFGARQAAIMVGV